MLQLFDKKTHSSYENPYHVSLICWHIHFSYRNLFNVYRNRYLISIRCNHMTSIGGQQAAFRFEFST